MWKAEEQAWLAPYYRSCKHRPASTTRAANVPRSTTSARFSPPSSIRIIADWKNKLRRGSRQFEETGTPVTKSSAKWTVRLSPACWRICHRPVSERMARRCVVGEEAECVCEVTGKPYRKSFNTAGMSGPFHAQLLLET